MGGGRKTSGQPGETQVLVMGSLKRAEHCLSGPALLLGELSGPSRFRHKQSRLWVLTCVCELPYTRISVPEGAPGSEVLSCH